MMKMILETALQHHLLRRLSIVVLTFSVGASTGRPSVGVFESSISNSHSKGNNEKK
jgi:hypothetical protein